MAALPASAAAITNPPQKPPRSEKPLPNAGEFFRFDDPVTETPVVRLTNPNFSSWIPAHTNRFISLRERFLVFSSDRGGKPAPFRADLQTGAVAHLGETTALDPKSLSLDTAERDLLFLDGNVLKQVTLQSPKPRTLAENITAFSVGDSLQRMVVVKAGKLQILSAAGSAFADNVDSWCVLRPGGTGCLFTREAGTELWYVSLTTVSPRKPVQLTKGTFASPCWSPDGRAVLLLRDAPTTQNRASEIHQIDPDTAQEQLVAATSQFAAFSPNRDGSVFVGASRSKAQPLILLLLRSVGRELSLCEHAAQNPASVSPVFAPDSRRVYFQSDYQGKPSLYAVNVERIVEPTPKAPEGES